MLRVLHHEDNTEMPCWNSGKELTVAVLENMWSHSHCRSCNLLGEAWRELEEERRVYIARWGDPEKTPLQWQNGRWVQV